MAASDKQAYVLEKQLPRDINYLLKMVHNPMLDLAERAKILEVMILRASQPLDLTRPFQIHARDSDKNTRSSKAPWSTRRPSGRR